MNTFRSASCATRPTMICATLIAVGSFTARAPVSVACVQIALSPVQPWQLGAGACEELLPRASATSG